MAIKINGSSETELNYSEEERKELQSPIDFYARHIDKASFELELGKEIAALQESVIEGWHANLFSLLLATLNVLLYRYTSQEDILRGQIITTAGLNTPTDYLSEIPYQNTVTGDDIFLDLLSRINNIAKEANQFQYIAFEKKDAESIALANADVSQIGQVALVLKNGIVQNSKEAELAGYPNPNYDLAFIFNKNTSGLSAKIEYTYNLYNVDTINTIASHFIQLLNSIAEDPKKKIGALPMLTEKEKENTLVKFNDTLTSYPSEKTIVDLFEEQVLKTPDEIALWQDELTLTYKELNGKANQVAKHLQNSFVKSGDNIGLLMSRGFDMIIGMFGILKAGAAYVPVDPEYPIDRQEYILSNSSANIIIADGEYPIKADLHSRQFINLKSLDLTDLNNENPAIEISSLQLAYTIYTSGSTGRPKGVMIAHHSAVNLISWVNKEFKIGVQDRLLFITSMCFDLSVYDIFGILSAGGSVVIVRQSELMDAKLLQHMLVKYKITFWDSVPTTMDYLIRELEADGNGWLQQDLRVVFMSGDWIPVNLPCRIKKYFPATLVISLGGATEGTVWSNFYPVDKVQSTWNSIPYGRPIDNNFFYILNDQLQPVPVGVAGELYIGGVGVAVGYANDKDKTAYSFVEDPFNSRGGGRMYRTGDLGKMSPDLNMIFIGRKDNQVKINGFRVELGEIETAICQHESIQQSVVIAKADNEGKKRLISYVVGKPGYDKGKIIDHLKRKLPGYMIPGLWMEIDRLPVTSNGKIDRKALPDIDIEAKLKGHSDAPATELERQLADIWKNVLNLDTVTTTANFFDMGGHSLLAVQIMTRIEKLTGKKLPISILFEYPTIEMLSAYIEKQNIAKNAWKSLVTIKPSGNKVPFYIVHGIGLNVLNFKNLSLYVDAEQPVFGFQAKGLDGIEEPLEDIVEVAKYYVSELIAHNPSGPYAIGGYSIGGFIAMEMAHQLSLAGRDVKFLAIFDTDADYTKDGSRIMPQKISVAEITRFSKLLIKYPAQTIHSLKRHFKEPENPYDQLVLSLKSDSGSFYDHIKQIRVKLESAFQQYRMQRFDGPVYLFRAGYSIHFTKDRQYLGWQKYTKKEVKEFEVPGDHSTIFNAKNAVVLGNLLQNALDNALERDVVIA